MGFFIMSVMIYLSMPAASASRGETAMAENPSKLVRPPVFSSKIDPELLLTAWLLGLILDG